jgi:hypothetical protein
MPTTPSKFISQETINTYWFRFNVVELLHNMMIDNGCCVGDMVGWGPNKTFCGTYHRNIEKSPQYIVFQDEDELVLCLFVKHKEWLYKNRHKKVSDMMDVCKQIVSIVSEKMLKDVVYYGEHHDRRFGVSNPPRQIKSK